MNHKDLQTVDINKFILPGQLFPFQGSPPTDRPEPVIKGGAEIVNMSVEEQDAYFAQFKKPPSAKGDPGIIFALKNVIDFMSYLIQAKLMIVRKMNQATGLARTFVKTPNGLKVVAPEGYVAIDHTGGAVKIVDKLEFSFNNFTVAKSWDK